MDLIRYTMRLQRREKMRHKKMLAILGSPHKDGVTARMLQCAIKAAEAAGWEVEQVNLYEKQIGFCRGCRRCLETRECVIKDDIQRIAESLRSCDVVALAAPVYWANVPAIVKNMFDRLLGAAMEETNTFPKGRLPGKKYFFFTACHTPAPFSWIFGQSRGAKRVVKEFFKTAGMTCGGNFVCANAGRSKTLSQAIQRKIQKTLDSYVAS